MDSCVDYTKSEFQQQKEREWEKIYGSSYGKSCNIVSKCLDKIYKTEQNINHNYGTTTEEKKT